MVKTTTILIIDDEPDFVESLKPRLEYEGFEVLYAADGLAGFHRLINESVDLILLDIMMPGMDGFSFIRAVREEEDRLNSPPIIAISAFRSILSDEDMEILGDIPFINKPFEFEELLQMIHAALGEKA